MRKAGSGVKLTPFNLGKETLTGPEQILVDEVGKAAESHRFRVGSANSVLPGRCFSNSDQNINLVPVLFNRSLGHFSTLDVGKSLQSQSGLLQCDSIDVSTLELKQLPPQYLVVNLTRAQKFDAPDVDSAIPCLRLDQGRHEYQKKQ
jgi:hypothetical protein